MPRLNGVELTRRIRQELPQTKIILMSTHTEDAYRLMHTRLPPVAVSAQRMNRWVAPSKPLEGIDIEEVLP